MPGSWGGVETRRRGSGRRPGAARRRGPPDPGRPAGSGASPWPGGRVTTASLPANSSGSRWGRCSCSVTRVLTNWCRRRTRVWSRCSAFEGWGRSGGSHLGGEAGQPAGIEAVGRGEDAEGAGDGVGLAGIDAHHRQAGRGQGRHHEPLIAAAGFQHDRVGRRAWRCSCNRRRPPRERGTVQVAPVGSTARSSWALATSIPTPTSAAVALGDPPATRATRPALQIRARADHGPGTCSGSAPASGPGRPCALTVSNDQGVIGRSRPCPVTLGNPRLGNMQEVREEAEGERMGALAAGSSGWGHTCEPRAGGVRGG